MTWIHWTLALSNLLGIFPLVELRKSRHQVSYFVTLVASCLMHLSETKHNLDPGVFRRDHSHSPQLGSGFCAPGICPLHLQGVQSQANLLHLGTGVNISYWRCLQCDWGADVKPFSVCYDARTVARDCVFPYLDSCYCTSQSNEREE